MCCRQELIFGNRHDTQGRLSTVTFKKDNGSTLGTPQVTTYTYDALGQKSTESSPNGLITTYAYDGEGQMTYQAMTDSYGDVIFLGLYSYNADGMKTGASEQETIDSDYDTATVNSAWTYDALNRLLTEKVTSSVSGQSFTTTYTYDLASNMKTKNHSGSGGTENTTFTYNADNEMTQQASSVSGTTTFVYDNNGSQLTATNGSRS